MPEKPPPLFIGLTHLHGMAVNGPLTPVPAEGLDLGRDDIALLCAQAVDRRGLCVAARHARLFAENMLWRVKALDRDFVTVINDGVLAQAETMPVAPGDVVELGFARLVLAGRDAPAREWEAPIFEEPEQDDPDAGLDAWREIAALAEDGDILRQLGHEGLRVLDNPESMIRPEHAHLPPRSQDRPAGREECGSLWSLCGAPENKGKSLTDFVLGEMDIDDVLAGLGQGRDTDLACGEREPEDPLLLLGQPEAKGLGGKRPRSSVKPSASPAAPRPAITLDSHYNPAAHSKKWK